MKKTLLFFAMLSLCANLSAQVQRRPSIPDVEDYKTLLCDFHIHTIFSDGQVMPGIRVEEAFAEGLDAVAITDHIEHTPNKKSGLLNADHNKAYEMAAGTGKARSKEVVTIHGSEITRGMPPGHWNAIFIDDSNPLDVKDWRSAMKAAFDQGAFMFWNHPGWEAQAPDSTKWYAEHTELFDKGYMMGIEVANTNHYFPEAFQWALDKNLTMLGNTDIHSTAGLTIDFVGGDHRTCTMVFAKDKTAASIRQALDNRQTLVWYKDMVIGRPEWIGKLVDASLKIKKMTRNANDITITFENVSDFEFRLLKTDYDYNLNYIRDKVIRPGETGSIPVSFKKKTDAPVVVKFTIENFLVSPGKGYMLEIPVPAYKAK